MLETHLDAFPPSFALGQCWLEDHGCPPVARDQGHIPIGSLAVPAPGINKHHPFKIFRRQEGLRRSPIGLTVTKSWEGARKDSWGSRGQSTHQAKEGHWLQAPEGTGFFSGLIPFISNGFLKIITFFPFYILLEKMCSRQGISNKWACKKKIKISHNTRNAWA